MEVDDMESIASLVKWSDTHLQKMFYDTFGKILHEKFTEYKECKEQLKESLSKNMDIKMRKTPAKRDPASKLEEQMRQMCNVADNGKDNNQKTPMVLRKLHKVTRNNVGPFSAKPISSPMVAAKNSGARQQRASPRVCTPKFNALKKTPLRANRPLQSTTPGHLNALKLAGGNAFATYKKEKIAKELDEKAMKALKKREEMLQQKAERAKREREERQRRVDENNRAKEVERRQREELMRLQAERLRKFQLEQANEDHQLRSPCMKSRRVGGTPKSASRIPIAVIKAAVNRAAVIHNGGPMSSAMNNDCLHGSDNHAAVDNHQVYGDVDQPGRPNSSIKVALATAHSSALEAHNSGEDADVDMTQCETADENQHVSVDTSTSESPVQFVPMEEFFASARENHSNSDGQHSTAGGQVLEDTTNSLSNATPKAANATRIIAEHKASYDITPDKQFLPSTQDNYNVDDLSSHDGTDNEEEPRKQIPKWAQKLSLRRTVMAQRQLLTMEQCEHHFGRIAEPDVNEFFGLFEREYPLRSSSAHWDSPLFDPTPGIARFRR